MNDSKIISIILTLTLITGYCYCQTGNQPEINVLYGEKHIFTVETPENWINDKDFAKQFGLVSFFYSRLHSSISQKSYIYANGIDKISSDVNLEDFVKGDLDKYSEKYPDFKYDIIDLGFTESIKESKLYSFYNLSDRYREEVLYCETDLSFLIFTFSATTKQNYIDYQPVFDVFIKSFNYRGNNPKPFLEYLQSKN